MNAVLIRVDGRLKNLDGRSILNAKKYSKPSGRLKKKEAGIT